VNESNLDPLNTTFLTFTLSFLAVNLNTNNLELVEPAVIRLLLGVSLLILEVTEGSAIVNLAPTKFGVLSKLVDETVSVASREDNVVVIEPVEKASVKSAFKIILASLDVETSKLKPSNLTESLSIVLDLTATQSTYNVAYELFL